jgi:hypothetical protein
MMSFIPWRATENGRRSHRITAALVGVAVCLGAVPAAAEEKRWSDAELVEAYRELTASGGLERAIRNPARPDEPPQPAFLEALAWFAARTPDRAGTLTLAELDEFLTGQVEYYTGLLRARVETGEPNDYGRTRTWKVIQKLTLLRDEMARPAHGGRYPYAALPRASEVDDPWERAHTLRSPEELAAKVCGGPGDRAVLVKFGNTNCTQCMLFELTGSVKEYAAGVARREPVEVYKVWWGLRPDGSFTGRVRDPERLDELARDEGVRSSPYFIVYRNGRRYPCGDAFPDRTGAEPRLDACLAESFGEAPLASVCAGKAEGR